ncbi:hypothetical protein E2C01_013605 [Portunus trituberculatus]|uniref:Uncharacterized protein n=1 Tax=Portunus trituberculatus TaxID=210409 RepID=A0A5B7DGQ3_PORTR|nr:hypothetical protein [Portunus trituberculatus]
MIGGLDQEETPSRKSMEREENIDGAAANVNKGARPREMQMIEMSLGLRQLGGWNSEREFSGFKERK